MMVNIIASLCIFYTALDGTTKILKKITKW